MRKTSPEQMVEAFWQKRDISDSTLFDLSAMFKFRLVYSFQQSAYGLM